MSDESSVSRAGVIGSAEKVAGVGIVLGLISMAFVVSHPMLAAGIYAVAGGLTIGAASTAVLSAGWHK